MRTSGKIVFKLQDDDSPPAILLYELITWVYRWDHKWAYSQALKELIDSNYFAN
jgi:hypothetical protein